MKKISPNRRIYQKNLITELDFSNKTIIEALKKLVSAGILEQGMERHKEKGKAVWTKWYTPTFQGKWLALLLQSQTKISKDEAREIIMELFSMYMENIVKLCTDYNIEPTIFESMTNKALLRMLDETKLRTAGRSRVAVYGSAAVDTIAATDRLPQKDESLYIGDVEDCPGGSAANVAIALRRLGIPVSFAGKIGDDSEGVLLMEEFQREGVNAEGIIVEHGKHTTKTFITVDQHGDKRIHILGGSNAALSITSPSEVDWSKIDESEITYVGEVFLEIAELIASYAQGYGKKVVYRPGLPMIEFGAEKVRRILRNTNILLMNQRGWNAIKNESDSTPANLTKLGPSTIIVTEGIGGCAVYTKDEAFTMPAYKVKATDTTGAGDAFAAGLIAALLEKKSLRDCAKYALAVAALKVEEKGARPGLPSTPEVEEFMKKQTTTTTTKTL